MDARSFSQFVETFLVCGRFLSSHTRWKDHTTGVRSNVDTLFSQSKMDACWLVGWLFVLDSGDVERVIVFGEVSECGDTFQCSCCQAGGEDPQQEEEEVEED